MFNASNESARNASIKIFRKTGKIVAGPSLLELFRPRFLWTPDISSYHISLGNITRERRNLKYDLSKKPLNHVEFKWTRLDNGSMTCASSLKATKDIANLIIPNRPLKIELQGLETCSKTFWLIAMPSR